MSIKSLKPWGQRASELIRYVTVDDMLALILVVSMVSVLCGIYSNIKNQRNLIHVIGVYHGLTKE